MRPLCLAVLLLFSGTQESDSLYIMSIVLNIMVSPDDNGQDDFFMVMMTFFMAEMTFLWPR